MVMARRVGTALAPPLPVEEAVVVAGGTGSANVVVDSGLEVAEILP
jgi:hypothetical protein